MKRFKSIIFCDSDINRFWKYVVKTDKCWLWKGCLQQKGYGTIMIGDERHSVHRFSWTLHKGKIPKGLFVCHHCDIPNCVNPEHLFLGDNGDNMRDASKKGRLARNPASYRGERNHRTKLTEVIVREIRSLNKIMSHKNIGEKFGLSTSGVKHIIHGRCWGHVL